MNIILINHYAGSPEMGMEFRPYYLAKEWIKQGHQVTIISANYSHLRNHQPEIKKDLESKNIDGITYIWLKTPNYKNSGIQRILNMLTFILKLFIYRNKIRKRAIPNVVIASSTYPLDIYPAYCISKKSNASLIFELHDMWPLSPQLIGGYSKYHPFIWLIQRAENFACKNCQSYISLLGNTKQYLVEHGLNEDKFHYIPNGFSLDEKSLDGIPIPKEHEELFKRLKAESNIIIGYAGGHAPSNALKSFVSASAHFNPTRKISFVLVGNGSQKSELMQIAKENNQNNVYFLPPVSKTSIPLLLNYFDMLYAGGTSSILHKYGTSYNKITDYMLAEKPIIFAVDEPNCLVEKVGCGIQIPAEDEAELVKTINLLSEMTLEERTDMGIKGREYALSELNYSSLAKKFIEVIEQY